MLLQLSHFRPFTQLHPPHPLPPTVPPYSSCPWVILISSLASTFPTLFLPSPCLFSDIPCSNIFIDMSPRARDIKEKINKWNRIKIKSFCMAKENSIKMKTEPTVWENIFANDTSDKGLISKIYKELT